MVSKTHVEDTVLNNDEVSKLGEGEALDSHGLRVFLRENGTNLHTNKRETSGKATYS